MRLSAINTYTPAKQNKVNNNKLHYSNTSRPAFCGHLENPIITNEYGHISCYILGRDMKPFFMGEENSVDINNDSKEKIADYLARNVKLYTEKFTTSRTFEKTQNKFDTTFYVADPNETVTDKIRDEHGYIVYDNEPKFPTVEQIKEKYTSEKPNPHDYFADLKDYMAYQQRSIYADKSRLENPLQNNTAEQEKYYLARINKSHKKVIYAQNLFNIMYKNGQDFMYKDELANKLSDWKTKYKTADKKLEDIAFHKYLTDESISRQIKDYERLKKNADSTNYQERMFRLINIRDSKEYSQKLQREYDMHANIKERGVEMIEQTQNELNRVLDKMSQNFKEVKAFYQDNKLEDIEKGL